MESDVDIYNIAHVSYVEQKRVQVAKHDVETALSHLQHRVGPSIAVLIIASPQHARLDDRHLVVSVNPHSYAEQRKLTQQSTVAIAGSSSLLRLCTIQHGQTTLVDLLSCDVQSHLDR